MIFALMLTCGGRKSRPRAYSTSSGNADGTSVMLTAFDIVSAVTVPRCGQERFCMPVAAVPTCDTGAGVKPTAPLNDGTHVRERRAVTISRTVKIGRAHV